MARRHKKDNDNVGRLQSTRYLPPRSKRQKLSDEIPKTDIVQGSQWMNRFDEWRDGCPIDFTQLHISYINNDMADQNSDLEGYAKGCIAKICKCPGDTPDLFKFAVHMMCQNFQQDNRESWDIKEIMGVAAAAGLVSIKTKFAKTCVSYLDAQVVANPFLSWSQI